MHCNVELISEYDDIMNSVLSVGLGITFIMVTAFLYYYVVQMWNDLD